MIDPRLLRTFLVVCRERSMSGAARALNLSQPSISVAIRQLERDLKAELFERNRKGIILNPAGEALLRRAELMEALLRDAEEEVALARDGVRGPLRIGGTPGALLSLAPAAIARIETQGRFALHIIERSDAGLAALLRKGDIELALVTTGIEAAEADFEERSIASDPFALIVGRANDHLPHEISLRETADLGWVLPQAAGGFYRQIQALFITGEIPMPRDVIRCDSLLTSKAIVRRSAHVTVLPRGVAATELSMGVLRAVRITDVDITRTIGIRRLAGRALSPLAQQFLDALLAENA